MLYIPILQKTLFVVNLSPQFLPNLFNDSLRKLLPSPCYTVLGGDIMNFTPAEIEAAQLAFSKQKRRMRLQSIPVIVLIVLFFGMRLLGEDHPWFLAADGWIRNPNHHLAVMGFAVVFIAYVLWIRLSWRCPHCKKNFGKQTNLSHCMHCGIPLE